MAFYRSKYYLFSWLSISVAIALLFSLVLTTPAKAVDYSNRNSPQTVLKDNWGTIFFPCLSNGKIPGDPALPTKYLEGTESDALFETVCLPSGPIPVKAGDIINKNRGGPYFNIGAIGTEPYETITSYGDTIGKIVGPNGSSSCNYNSAIDPMGASSPTCYKLDRSNGLAASVRAQYQATQNGQGGGEKQTCINASGKTIIPGSLCLKIDGSIENISGTIYFKDSANIDTNGLCTGSLLMCVKAGTPVTGTPVPTVVYAPPTPIQGKCNVTETNAASQISTPVSGGTCTNGLSNLPTGCFEQDSSHQIQGCAIGQMCCSDEAIKTIASTATEPTQPPEDPNAGQPYQRCRRPVNISTREVEDLVKTLPGAEDQTENKTWWQKFTQPLSFPTILRGITGGAVSLFRDINSQSETGVDIILKKSIGDLVPPDSISHTAPEGKGQIFQYFFGCEGDAICASSRDLDYITGRDVENGEDVCIPNQSFPGYLADITDEKYLSANKLPGSTNVASALDPVMVTRNLSMMCFKQIPYADTLPTAFVGGGFKSWLNRDSQKRFPKWAQPFLLQDFTKIGGIYGALSRVSEGDSAMQGGGLLLGLFNFVPNKYWYVREYFGFKDGLSRSNVLTNNCDNTNPPQNHCTWLAANKGNPSKTPADLIEQIDDTRFINYAAVPQENIKQLKSSLAQCLRCAYDSRISTAIGCLPVDDVGKFITETFFGILMGLAGAYCMLCLIYGAIRFQTSQGNSTEIEKARKQITQCLLGLLLIIFSVFILRVLGVMILRIPGFN